MKKNMKLCWVIVLSFVIGFVFGVLAHASRDWFPTGGAGLCVDGTEPDKHGCCDGELYTDMGDLGYNCCPESGGDCFPPIK